MLSASPENFQSWQMLADACRCQDLDFAADCKGPSKGNEPSSLNGQQLLEKKVNPAGLLQAVPLIPVHIRVLYTICIDCRWHDTPQQTVGH